MKEPVRECPWPGWRYADERDIGKEVCVTDQCDKRPEDCIVKVDLVTIRDASLPFRCDDGFHWKHAYVKLP